MEGRRGSEGRRLGGWKGMRGVDGERSQAAHFGGIVHNTYHPSLSSETQLRGYNT